ncbi:uncharacterized protein METZ01_LOCUS495880, partial [marine metagenome]
NTVNFFNVQPSCILEVGQIFDSYLNEFVNLEKKFLIFIGF